MTPERSPARDAAIDLFLPYVPESGWTRAGLARALAAAGLDPEDAETLFPGGAADMVEAFCDLGDRRMAEPPPDPALSLTKRVRAVLARRFAQQAGNKEAVRRAVAVLSRPSHAVRAAACTARTVDAIWHAAGDTSTDFSWYTKRALLAGVYASTLLIWLRDWSEDDAATMAFLDRRLRDVGNIGRARGRVMAAFARHAAA